MTNLYWLLLPVTAALIIKGTILLVAKRAAIKTEYLFAFIATFAVHNLCEVLVIFDAVDGTANMLLYRVYYAITFVLIAYACSMGIEIGNARRYWPFLLVEKLIWAASFIGVIFSLFTPKILMGLTSLGYSYTAIRGDSYALFLVTAVLAMVFGIMGIASGLTSANDERQRQRSVMALIAFFPIVFAALGVLGMMSVGININGLVALPLGSALFLSILVYSERKHGLTDIKKLLPGTNEKKVIARISALFSEYALGNSDYYPAIDEIERLMVSYAHDKHEGNIMRTAKHMGVSRSTLYKKMSKHKVGRAHNKAKPGEAESLNLTMYLP
ncbi:MAG: hypothetical protein ACI9SX_000794 [Pseudoalteromonas tetraodonis]|jgi:hypothetical protein